jgi:hypothetical protein
MIELSELLMTIFGTILVCSVCIGMTVFIWVALYKTWKGL